MRRHLDSWKTRATAGDSPPQTTSADPPAPVLLLPVKMSNSSASSDDFNQQRHAAHVEVLMPETANECCNATEGIFDSGSASVAESSAGPDEVAIMAAALAKLPPDLQEQAKDPKRKAWPKVPGWKYGFIGRRMV